VNLKILYITIYRKLKWLIILRKRYLNKELEERNKMPENQIKKDLRKAEQKAIRILRESFYAVDFLRGDNPFTLQAIRKSEIRFIKIMTDQPKKETIEILKTFLCPENITKEIWVERKKFLGGTKFEYMLLN